MKWLQRWRRPDASILLVCRANVCRSPMAEALLRHRLEQLGLSHRVRIASAGTSAVAGAPPDPRGRSVLAERGVPMTRRRSRPLNRRDYERYDHILAMDEEVLAMLQERCPTRWQERVQLVTRWQDGQAEKGIPDPYYGNLSGFERVCDLLEQALDAFIEKALLPRLSE